ncbi:hypothetical protein HG531_011906 [Fusarium graminearum]|nr:hypothetical protein HG531_011906 [Fusarium graminearum]
MNSKVIFLGVKYDLGCPVLALPVKRSFVLEILGCGGCDTSAVVWRKTKSPAFAVEFDERVFASRQEEAFVCSFAIDNHGTRAVLILHLGLRLHKLQAGDLVLVSSQLELTNFCNKVPHDDVRIPRSTGKSDAGLVEYKFCDCRLVSIEVEYNGGNLAVPKSNAAVLISDSEYILVGFALRDRSHRYRASLISPAAYQLTLFNIPTNNFLVRGDNRLSCAGSRSVFGRPHQVRSWRGDDAEGLAMLVFSV